MSYGAYEGLIVIESASRGRVASENCDAKSFHFSSVYALGIPSAY